jgi:hypothetical protein
MIRYILISLIILFTAWAVIFLFSGFYKVGIFFAVGAAACIVEFLAWKKVIKIKQKKT